MATNPFTKAKDFLTDLAQQGRTYVQSTNLGKQVKQVASQPVPKTLQPLATGLEKIYNTKSQIISTPLQFGAGLIQGQNLNLGQSPYRTPVTTPEKIAYTVGSVAGAMNPKGITQRVVSPIIKATNPIISKTISPIANKFVTGRLASGIGNVIQGSVINPVYGRKPLEGAALDFVSGVAFGPNQFKTTISGLKTIEKVKPKIEIPADDVDEIINGYRFIKSDAVLSDTNNVYRNFNQTVDHYLKKSGISQKAISKMSPDQKYDMVLPIVKSNIEFRSGVEVPLSSGFVSQAKKFADSGQLTQVPETQKYLKELSIAKANAKSGAQPTFRTKISNTLSEIKKKMVDSNAPIEDALDIAQKKYAYSVLPRENIKYQIDRVLRSKTLASQFAEDNGLADVIRKAPDLEALDQYMIAKQSAAVNKLGIKTGRDSVRDQRLIKDLSNVYEPLAKEVNNYSRVLLDYSVRTGLIDKKLASDLIKKYPEYVPLQRVFSELEQKQGIGTKPIASLSKQTIVKKLEGSERQIESPIESLLTKTQDAFNQGERNIAGKQLASYAKLPGFEGLIKEGDGPHTFSFLDNGVKRTFSTTPEIAAAAKNLNQEQIGLLGKIFQYPTRLLQVGSVVLNLPFVATNVLKDEITGFVNSTQAAKTSLLNPANFVKSLFSAVKHDDLYKEVVRNAAGGTSFDISRQAPNLSVAKIRAGKDIVSNIKYTVTNPRELLRAIEDVIGRSEELGRIKNYAGAKEGFLLQGRTAQDATLLAADNARSATANFARKGEWGRVLNYMIPFFNAGIQGARQLVRSFSNNPAGTAAKVGISIFAPIAASTAWNLSDPERKKAYEDIHQYEKDNNIIIVPPSPTKDAKGKWNVIKIPLPPGLSNLGTIERKALEQAHGLDPIKFMDIFNNLIAAGTSIDMSSSGKLLSSTTPQLLKPAIETFTNTNLFTGQKIVPEYMKSKLPEEQVKSYTSGTARKIGGVLNTSPLLVENAIKTSMGGLGSQLINASDVVLNKLGVIPESQVGGESVGSNIERRFSKASGGNLLDKIYTDSDKYTQTINRIKELAKSGDSSAADKFASDNIDIIQRGKLVSGLRDRVDKINAAKNKLNKMPSIPKKERDQANIDFNNMLTEISNEYNQLLKK